jgi:N-acetylglutamate synthase
MTILIREISICDHDKAIRLWKSCPGIEVDDDDLKKNFKIYLARNPGLCFVAYEGDTLVGAVKCGHDGRRGYLHHLAVRAEYRKKGLAKKLIARSLANLKKQGIRKCNCFVFDSNRMAKTFWKHNGWKQLTYDYRTLQISLQAKAAS